MNEFEKRMVELGGEINLISSIIDKNKKRKEEKNNQMVNISNNKNVSGINVSQNIFNNSDREE